jgi:hypothetical protein
MKTNLSYSFVKKVFTGLADIHNSNNYGEMWDPKTAPTGHFKVTHAERDPDGRIILESGKYELGEISCEAPGAPGAYNYSTLDLGAELPGVSPLLQADGELLFKSQEACTKASALVLRPKTITTFSLGESGEYGDPTVISAKPAN